jgi:glycosyltransferase involved in cell wall biosynthesis
VRRVALVCEPPDGGVAEHVLHLALGLPEHGYDPVVFAPPGFAHAARLADAGRPLRPVPLRRDYRHPHSEVAATLKLRHAARREGFELVHCHSAKAGVLGRAAAASASVPAVYTPHCFPFVGLVSRRRKLFSLTVERALARRSSAIVCVCDDERSKAVGAGLNAARLVVVINGSPDCEEGPPDPTLVDLKADGLLVAAVTVLRCQKGVDVLLAATPRVLAEVPEARVAIVGNGPEEGSLRAQAAQLGLTHDSRFAFAPYVGPPGHHLRAVDLYVLPSRWEALSMGLLEAQACGVPQVATAVGGTGEVVTRATGQLVSPEDPVGLADAIVSLLRDPARRRAMAAASRARHAALFTTRRMVEETAAVYDSILAGRR